MFTMRDILDCVVVLN